ncbi:hypothetical protein RCO27_05360 [Sphingosinicella sp. LHD-64]|uniref:hypothetical protein n=1 Tax=Sphingosinicella sp. LHD-64 TaxID=3072139 RepID=UPI00280EA276|nr:hypothetical protein [Sphingosinicella sp. LHD-64]MDQ8755650.1 hypothetical protein [Sphingosinicella sp. LHD-64]
MTLSINGNDIGQAIEIALTVGTIVMLVIGAFLVWLMVRPSKRSAPPRRRGMDEVEMAEMLQLLDRMEDRLAALERIVAHESETPSPRIAERREGQEDRFLKAGEESPETRRTK